MKKFIIALVLGLFLFAGVATAATIPLEWDPSTGATGYIVYTSIDGGASWDTGVDVGNVTSTSIPDVPDAGMVLFRVGAYNSQGSAIQYKSGAWYNGSWTLPEEPGGLGIQ